MNQTEKLLTPAEVAARCRISRSLVYQLIEEGRIRALRIGGKGRRGKLLVADEMVEAFLAECRAELEDD